MQIIKSILIILFAVLFYTDCKSQGNIDFQSENDFKNALHGTWILKSYRDSIEKGQTPAMIHDLLNGINRFYYNPGKKYSNIFPQDSSYFVFIDSKENFIQMGYSIKFDLKNDSVTIIEKDISSYYDTVDKKWKDKFIGPKNIGKISISTYNNDTLMSLSTIENSQTNEIELIKYVDYDQLINNKFIDGTYYVENDTTKLICFSSNGYVSGLVNLDKSLFKADQYYISVGYFSDNRDNLCFQRTGHESIFPCFYWTKLGNDLILEKQTINKDKIDYKLIKINTPYNILYK
ncbi:hypothetical protein [Mangrovibacterium diazotrophicum]|uniref:Uncharacterized protein n=1 Tax=Mangrovibacterium diazotrophicum TaxID=1261403 RepID=A0A419VWS1_9BACT|nr:hypothetical protein [Mangrovibacterium diazotrophicum]RKD86558.1 hypothetical protein BC643_4256 [Mangrovibacterium diazotrophicum]